MAFKHGKDTVITLNAIDISAFTNSTTQGRESDSHDVTTYGKTAHVYNGGLLDGTVTLAGIYDDGATGPRTVIEPLLGTNVTFTFKPEGTGAGKPEDSVNVLVMSYEETAPVADMISWSCELQMSDAVTTTDQV